MVKVSLKHITLILTIMGILLLYFLSTLAKPVPISLDEIENYDGKKVIIQGRVTDFYITKSENQIITITNNSASVIVFLEEEFETEYGDIIQVTGKVQQFDNKWEIIVDNNRYINIVDKWNNISTPIWQLARNPNNYIGVNVNLTGIVDRIYDTYFYIIDEEEQHSLIVFYNPYTSIDLYPGLKIELYGRFVYEEETLRYKIKIDEPDHRISIDNEGI